MKQQITLLLTLALTSITVFGQKTYVFEGQGNWEDPSQWKNNEYPGQTVLSGDTVEITGILTIPTGFTVKNEGKIESYNLVNSTPEITIEGSLINDKTISLSRTQCIITGELQVNNNATFELVDNSKIVNEGIIKLIEGVLEINSSVSDITNKASIYILEPSKIAVNAGKLTSEDNGNIYVDGKILLENGELDNKGNINISKTGFLIANQKSISNKSNGEIVNLGNINITGYGSLNNTGTLTNKAIILIDADSFIGFKLSNGSVFNNQGVDAKVSISKKSTISVNTTNFNLEEGLFINNGKFEAQNDIVIGVDAELVNNGTFENGFGGKFYNKGIFKGINTQQKGDIINSGVLSPGNETDVTGLYKLDGFYTSYKQTADGSLNIDLGGTLEGNTYDQVFVDKNITLDGTLNVTLVNGFEPSVGDTFTIIKGSRTVSGVFSKLNLPTLSGSKQWDTILYESSVVLRVKDASLSIDEVLEGRVKITIYPNPANEKIFVSGLSELTEACIYDINGNELLRTKLTIKNSEINLRNLKSGGVYFLKLGKNSYKFIKK